MESEYKTICDTCYQGTYYETEQPCRRSLTTGCPRCGSHEYISESKLCKGTLRVIDKSNLNSHFDCFYRDGQRIEVTTASGEKLRGYVGKTTGWKPSYMLLAKKNSIGSSVLLGSGDFASNTFNTYRWSK